MTVSRTDEAAEAARVLERAAHAVARPPVGRHVVDAVAEHLDLARRLHEPGDRVHQRGLARAVRADEADDLAGAYLDRLTPTTTGRPPKLDAHVVGTASGARGLGHVGRRPIARGRQRRDARLRAPLGRRPARAAGDERERSWSRTLSTIEISPPGQYSSRISMPTPLANSCSCCAALNTVGMATITSVPRTAPVTDDEPADHRDREHAERLGRHEVVGDLRGVPGREQPARERGDAAGDRECDQLRARGRHRVGGGVASRCRAPRAASGPIPVRRKWLTITITMSARRGRSSSRRCLSVGEVERRTPIGGSRRIPNPVNEVLNRSCRIT